MDEGQQLSSHAIHRDAMNLFHIFTHAITIQSHEFLNADLRNSEALSSGLNDYGTDDCESQANLDFNRGSPPRRALQVNEPGHFIDVCSPCVHANPVAATIGA